MKDARAAGADRGVVLVSELFPPDVGGTPSLFSNVYRRLGSTDLRVLTSVREAPALVSSDGPFAITRIPMAAPHWGITNLGSLRRYWRVIARMRVESARRATTFHCARALPEGLAALCATSLSGSSNYLCWTHGEELHYASSSRELSFLLARVHRGAAAIIANSRYTARELERIGVPQEKVRVVYPGVDVERFSRCQSAARIRSRYASPDDVLLLTVGRLQRRKGHDLAIAAVASLGQEIPRLKYLIVGEGEERSRLEKLVDQHGLCERVVFAGAVDDDALPAYYAAADVFLHPNRVDGGDVEGFGIVFLEAAAASKPVIGGGTGGVPEAVEQGVTGLLVTGTDVGELAEAVRVLARDPVRRREMGDAGRARVSRQFTWARAAAEVTAIQKAINTEPVECPEKEFIA